MAPTEGGLETGGIDCFSVHACRALEQPKMPRNCCVPFCNTTSKKNKNLRFHRFAKKKEQKRALDLRNSPRRRIIFYCYRQYTGLLEAFSRGGLHHKRRWERKKIYLRKGAVPSVFQWTAKKRSRISLASKRKGETLELPRKKRPRQHVYHLGKVVFLSGYFFQAGLKRNTC